MYGNICQIFKENSDVYLNLLNDVNTQYANQFGVSDRYRRYMDSQSIPAYANTNNLTGDAYEIAVFDYYCNNLG